MVSKEVLKRIGVFAVAAVVAVSPVLAVNANGGVQLPSAKAGTEDPGTGDPESPSPSPSAEPTTSPSTEPTASPSTEPTAVPTTVPSTEPTTEPSTVPTTEPSTAPTMVPTAAPSTVPTMAPSTEPTAAPTETPEDSSEGSQEYVADVVTMAGGTVLRTTVPGTYRATVVEGVAVTTPLSAVNAAFGAGRGDCVEMVCLDTRCGEQARASINDGLTMLEANGIQAQSGAVLDMMAYLNGRKVVDINNPITITIGIPASFRQAGYEYAVIRVQEGGRVSILPNRSEDPSVLSVESDGFGVFAIIKAPAGSFDIFR